MILRALIVSWIISAGALGIEPLAAQMPGSLPNSAMVGERFHLILFTAQDAIKAPRETHTWGLMVRSIDGRIVETQSISWMPSNLKIKTWQLSVEPGTNFRFDETIRWTLTKHRQRISVWGPYEADPQLYARFVTRKTQLESGALGYQCLDFLGEAAVRRNGVNCVHALAPIQGPMSGDIMQPYGDASGRYFADNLQRRGAIGPYVPTNDWLLLALGLDQVPLDRSGNAATSRPILPRASSAAGN